jgi:hypothetical protein
MYLQLNRQSSADGGIILQTNNANDWQIVNANGDLWFYSYGIGTTAFRVMRNNGNFLINTTTDNGSKLRVNGNLWVDGVYQVPVSSYFICGTAGFRFNNSTDAFNNFVILDNGNTTTRGSSTATSFFESSDTRLKSSITNLDVDVRSILAKHYIKQGDEEIGYIAQDVESILPSAISKRKDGYLDLSYRQVHTAKIAYLEKRIEELESQLKYN